MDLNTPIRQVLSELDHDITYYDMRCHLVPFGSEEYKEAKEKHNNLNVLKYSLKEYIEKK